MSVSIVHVAYYNYFLFLLQCYAAAVWARWQRPTMTLRPSPDCWKMWVKSTHCCYLSLSLHFSDWIVLSYLLPSLSAYLSVFYSMLTWSWLSVGMSILFYCLHFHIGRCEYLCSRRLPTVPELLSIVILLLVNTKLSAFKYTTPSIYTIILSPVIQWCFSVLYAKLWNKCKV